MVYQLIYWWLDLVQTELQSNVDTVVKMLAFRTYIRISSIFLNICDPQICRCRMFEVVHAHVMWTHCQRVDFDASICKNQYLSVPTTTTNAFCVQVQGHVWLWGVVEESASLRSDLPSANPCPGYAKSIVSNTRRLVYFLVNSTGTNNFTFIM